VGFLFGGGGSNANNAPKYTGVDVQTSAYGLVVPLVYGVTRLAGNLIWYDGFKAIAKNAPGSGGGKGGAGGSGGKGGGSTTYTYQADLLLCLCEGPISGVGNMWKSQTETTPAAEGFSIITGTFGQAAWSFLTSNYPSVAVGYSGFALAGGGPAQLGTSAQLPNYNFEVEGLLAGTAPNGIDADPSQVIPDLLTNANHGAGFPASRLGQLTQANEAHTIPTSGPYTVSTTNASAFEFNLDVVDGSGNLFTCVASSPGAKQYSIAAGVYTFNAADAGTAITIRYAWLAALANYQNFTLAAGLFVSPFYDQQQQASQIVDDLSALTYASFVWSSGVLTLVPRATVGVTGNGYTYTPPAAPLFDLTDDDFLPNTNATGAFNAGTNNDPVILSRSRTADQINDVKVEFLDRSNQYATSIAEVTDQALLDRFGRRAGASKTAHFFCLATAANASALYQVQDQYIRNQYSFTLDQRYCVLDPMDIVTLTDSYLGLAQQWVRITEITENDDGTLSITAEEYPNGTGAPPTYSLNTGSGYVPNYNQSPGNVNTPLIFMAPTQLTGGVDEVWMAVSGASAVWGGCDVWVSTDNTTYELVGRHYGPARMGASTALFPSGSDPDTTNTLSVDLTESFGQLSSTTSAGADNYNTLCYIGGEFIAYETATLTSSYNYNLTTYIRRGIFGSTIASHAMGTGFCRIDDGLFAIPLSSQYSGKTLYIKLASFNIWEGGLQDVSSLGHFTFSPSGNAGAPLAAPTGFTITPSLRGGFLQWTNASGTVLAGTEVWRNTSNTFGTASLLGSVAEPGNTFTDNSAAPNTTYYYWLVPVDDSGNTGPSVSSSGTTALTGSSDYGGGSVTNPAIGTGAVGTGNIATNAVSVTASVVGGGAIVPSSGYVTVASVSFTLSQAAKVAIIATSSIINASGSAAAAQENWSVSCSGSLGSGTVGALDGTSVSLAFSAQQSLAAGSYTAVLQLGNNASSQLSNADNCISVIALAR
jgi:hypothetical protein